MNFPCSQRIACVPVLLALTLASSAETPPPKLITHSIKSEFLGGVETKIHVLLPGDMEEGKRYPVLYILPVIDGKAQWGEPFKIAQEKDFPGRYNAICVMPTFDRGTLYVDHPTKPHIQHESYFVKTVVPFVDEHYPTIAAAQGRLLTGFCASGSGSMWLLLRNPDLFGKAAAWDTWFDLDHLHPPDKKQVGNEDYFRENYSLQRLIDRRAEVFKKGPVRIYMMSYRSKRKGHFAVTGFHGKLIDHGIPHVLELHPKEKHRWDSGWLDRAVAYLFMEPAKKLPKVTAGEKEE